MIGQGATSSNKMTLRGEPKKRTKAKEATHGLHSNILNDSNIKAKSNWEKEEVEYWTFKMYKQYVKMYHIDRLCP